MRVVFFELCPGTGVEMMKGDRRATFSEAGGDLVIQNRLTGHPTGDAIKF
jgi:hypothetical protein